ncbi:MAG: type II toxin-antitoxin system VapC family toxin [Bacteroidota bacterium]
MIVFDTHTWVRWAEGGAHLTAAQREAIEDAGQLGVSVISVWEVAKLAASGRLELDRPAHDWIKDALRRPRLILVPLTPEMAAESAALPGTPPTDPADQIIAATARVLEARLLTSDSKLEAYPHVETVV